MKKTLTLLFAFCLIVSTAVSGSALTADSGADADAARDEVWGRYLSSGEKATLSAMAAAGKDAGKGTGAPAPEQQDMATALRNGFLAMAEEYIRSAPPVAVETYEANGVKGLWLTPEGVDGARTILYLHGGAYMVGTADTPRSITAFLANAVGARCFSLEYPLAPEHPFPAALDNAEQAYRMLLEQGREAKSIVLAGDSAGGGLTLALLLRLREAGLPMPAGAYLISPWADLTNSGDTHRSKGAVDIAISEEFITFPAGLYAGRQDKTNPLISPVFANLRGLPPLLIQVGTHERLLGDAVTIAKNAAEADVPVRLDVWPGYPHVFQFYQRDLEGGRKALREAADFLGEALAGTTLR